MKHIHGLRPKRVVKAFERAGWNVWEQKGSHVKLTREGNPNIPSISVVSVRGAG
jgi:predicted RNA binding protein YcfA (HicA-like mRNA interferase family)